MSIYPSTSLDRPSWPPEFLDNRHIKAAMLSVLPPGAFPHPLKISLVLIYVRRWVDPGVIVRQEGLSQWKIQVIPSGIAPATCQRLAQYLKQLRHRVPPLYKRNKLRDYNNACACRCTGLNFKQLTEFCETGEGGAPLEGFLNSLQLVIKTRRSHKMLRQGRLSSLQSVLHRQGRVFRQTTLKMRFTFVWAMTHYVLLHSSLRSQNYAQDE